VEDNNMKNLIGLTINGKKITEKTPSEHWAGNFWCSDNNKLTSLVGAPSSVGGYFYCYNNKLTSLVGAPSSVGGYFDCGNNQLTSLEGAPSSVGGGFYCSRNQLTSLKGIEKILKKMNGTFFAYGNPLESHVIGLLLVPGCKEVGIDNNQVKEILNRHLQSPFGNKRVIECQSELLDSGLDDFSKL
jgi:Leucine-rich repeat (LRR) protein